MRVRSQRCAAERRPVMPRQHAPPIPKAATIDSIIQGNSRDFVTATIGVRSSPISIDHRGGWIPGSCSQNSTLCPLLEGTKNRTLSAVLIHRHFASIS